MTKPREDRLAIAFLIILLTVFFAKELFTGATLVTYRLTNVFPWLSEATRADLDKPSVTSDCTFSYYPRRVFATEMMRQGKIPFWNPHQFCGTPFFANFQSGVFYPVNLAIYWMRPTTQMDVFLYVHFLIAAVFGYLLGRKLKLSVEASVVSSLTFTFCSFMVTRYGQPTLVSTASWLPAILYFGEHLIEAPSLRRAGLLGLAFSFCVLAGFPQLVLFAFYTGFLYIVLRVLTAGSLAPRRKVQTLALAALAVVVACFICAFQLLPTYELSKFSYRRVLPYSMVHSSAHHAFVTLKYLIPDILGDPLEMSAIAKSLASAEPGPAFGQNYVSTAGYIGILPLLLAILALTKPRRALIPFAVLSGLALLTVFGTPLLRLFYAVLPGFNFSRIDRVVVIYMLGFSVLAGYGFDLARGADGKGRLLACGAGLMVIAAILALWLRNSGLAVILRHAGASTSISEYLAYASAKILWFMVLAAAGGTLVVLKGLKWLSGRTFFLLALVIILADLLPNAVKFKVSQPADRVLPASSFVDDLVDDRGTWRLAKYGPDILPANTATIIGLDDIHGYDALNIKHYIEVLGAMDSSMTSVATAALRRRIGPIGNQDALASPILNLLNVKYVLTVVWGGSDRPKPMAFRNEDYLPRAFLVGTPHLFPTYDEMLAYMRTAEFDPRREVLLAGTEPPAGIRRSEAGDTAPGSAEIVASDESSMTVRVQAASASYLVISDVFYPGWRASVDGREVAALRADYAFRAVPVEAGSHTVKLAYKPLYFTLGLLFSVAGLALLVVMISSRQGGAEAGGGQN
jgi:hypothetical protein